MQMFIEVFKNISAVIMTILLVATFLIILINAISDLMEGGNRRGEKKEGNEFCALTGGRCRHDNCINCPTAWKYFDTEEANIDEVREFQNEE